MGGVEHADGGIRRRRGAEHGLEVGGDVAADPGRAEHPAGAQDEDPAIGFDEDVGEDLAEIFGDDEARAAVGAASEESVQRELPAARGEDGALGDARVGGEGPGGLGRGGGRGGARSRAAGSEQERECQGEEVTAHGRRPL